MELIINGRYDEAFSHLLTIHASAPSDGLTVLMRVLMSVTISLGRIAQLLYVTMPIVGVCHRGSMQVMCIRYR